jgi:hypothetical protein
MKKALLIGGLAVLFCEGVFAQNGSLPASKAAVQVTKFTIAPANGTWTTILNTQIKTAPKTLMIDVSLNTALVTTTAITGTGSNSSTAGVLVRVLVDGNPALPGAVVFNRRTQTLSGSIANFLTNCNVNISVPNLNTLVTAPVTCTSTPSMLQLTLNTMDANSFRFLEDIGTGIHTIQVQVQGTNAAGGTAIVGPGVLTVEEIRLVHDAQLIQQ